MGRKPSLTLMDYGNICDFLDDGKNYREVMALTEYSAATIVRINAFRRAVMRGDTDEIVRMKNMTHYSNLMCEYVEKRYVGGATNTPKPSGMKTDDTETVQCDPTNLLLHGLDALVNAMNRIADEMSRMNGKVVE